MKLLSESVPFEFKKDILISLTDAIKRKLQASGVKEEDILDDFEKQHSKILPNA